MCLSPSFSEPANVIIVATSSCLMISPLDIQIFEGKSFISVLSIFKTARLAESLASLGGEWTPSAPAPDMWPSLSMKNY